ncbi:MAG: flagellar hook-associated protein FlgL [Pseudomonadota bacterium]
MLYRVSQKSLFRSINTNLSLLTYDMSQVNNQLATGRKVNKPSDDPSGGAVILSMRSILAGAEQYNKDVALADDWLNETENVLTNMKTTLTRAYELAEQMSTDTYREDNQTVAAEEIDKIIESMVKMGNTRIGDRYLFSGMDTENPAFTNDLTVRDPEADPDNNSDFTGRILSPAVEDRAYATRPNLPEESKVFMVEITSEGGVGGPSQAALTIDDANRNHDGVKFTAQPAQAGSAGNLISVTYNNAADGNAATAVSAVNDLGGGAYEIVVNLGNDGTNITASANDVINAVNGHAGASALVSAVPEEGNSGLGTIGQTGTWSLSRGYDNAARFRVSEDGGQTWGPESEYAVGTAGTMITNNSLGHASLTTTLPNPDQNLVYTAVKPQSAGNDIKIKYVNNTGNSGLGVSLDWDSQTITVELADAGGAITSTANDVMAAINSHAEAGLLVDVSLADYQAGGDGVLRTMNTQELSGGNNDNIALGHAVLVTNFDGAGANVRFTARQHGDPGNDIQIQYVKASPAQTETTVTDGPGNLVTVNLATDPDGVITSTAQDVVDAVNYFATGAPTGTGSSLVTASLAFYPTPGDLPVSVLGPTNLSGGDDNLKDADYGVDVWFQNDGSPLTAGDKFSIEVSHFQGDAEAIEVNANQGYRVKINVTGEEALGAAGAEDNIIDTLSRLKFALANHLTDKISNELPNLDDALERVTTQMSKVGVRLARNQFNYDMLANQEVSSTERLSRFEDVDIADAVTRLQLKQTAYQATLAATSLITKLSLVDYIG